MYQVANQFGSNREEIEMIRTSMKPHAITLIFAAGDSKINPTISEAMEGVSAALAASNE
jgi:hypothetical protein